VDTKSHVLLYTLSMGVWSLFERSSQLGSLVHATDAEKENDVEQIEKVKATYNMAVGNVTAESNAISVSKGSASGGSIAMFLLIICTE
jgi:hypothetical protein